MQGSFFSGDDDDILTEEVKANLLYGTKLASLQAFFFFFHLPHP
jgi:hypothetical protein